MKHFSIVIAALLTPLGIAQAEPLVGLTLTNDLVKFTSAAPGAATTTSITGLVVGDALVGIDVRPFNNVLYGFATDSGAGGANTGVGRVYSIDVTTGAATLASTLSADLVGDTTAPFPFESVDGTFFGVDFNPVVDRLRVVSDTGQNLRINVVTGLTQLDVPLAYAAADDNNGSPPMVVASAYSNSFNGAGSTTLFGIDTALSTLVTQTPANNGTLNTLAITSLTPFADTAFDISGTTGDAYVVIDGLTLASIDLASGAITDIGPINTIGAINGLAVLVPEPTGFSLIFAAGIFGWMARQRQRRLPSRNI